MAPPPVRVAESSSTLLRPTCSGSLFFLFFLRASRKTIRNFHLRLASGTFLLLSECAIEEFWPASGFWAICGGISLANVAAAEPLLGCCKRCKLSIRTGGRREGSAGSSGSASRRGRSVTSAFPLILLVSWLLGQQYLST